MNYSKKLSERIAGLRKSKGMTQEQLASRLGVTYQAVSKWENEQSCPDIALLPTLADIFELSLDELFGRSAEASFDLREGLLAEYLFDGNAHDSSGGDKHGRIAGAVLCENRFGDPDSAYYFDGKDDYIVMDPAPSLNGEAFSLSVWCKYDDNSRMEGWHSAIVSQDGHLDRRVFQLSTLDDRITFHRFMFEPDLYAKAPLHQNYWYHIVVTYTDHHFKLYKNGVLINEVPGSLRPDGTEPLYVGRKSTEEPYFFFHGVIDDIRIYNRSLCLEEVNGLLHENGWIPAKEPELRVEERKELPLLECVTDINIYMEEENIHAAAEWYRTYLGFKLHMEYRNEFYMLTLYKGPQLLLYKASPTEVCKEVSGAIVFKTKRPIEELRAHLAAAGAVVQEIIDEGFAYYLKFIDPFGYPWTILQVKK